MLPLQYDLRSPATKDNSITYAAKTGSNLDAATTMRSAKTELQTAIPFTLREQSYSYRAEWNSIGNLSISNTCNLIYIAGTILQLQITMEFCRPHMHEKHLQTHLQCGTDPTMIRPHTRPSRTRRTAEVDHRGLRTDFIWKNTAFVYLLSLKNTFRARLPSKLHRQLIHQHHLQSHLHCGNDPTVANHNGILSIAHARKTLETPFTMRNQSENDSTTHETVSHPSHRRGSSSTFEDGLCMEKHRLSCVCSLKNAFRARLPSKLYRQLIHQHHLQSHLHCGNDPTIANHNGILSTAHARRTLEAPFTMRNRSDHDPRIIRSHTRPSRTRRTAKIDHQPSGTYFIWKNTGFRAFAIFQNCIFVRDFLQNSIGNSPTSTTCNPIYIAGIISLTNSFPNELFLCSFFD